MDENKWVASRKRRFATSLRLEPLEGRRLLAASASQVGIKEVATSGVVDLVITGTNKADVIGISDNGTGAAGNITVSLGGGRTYVSQSAITVIQVKGQGGDDQVSYDLNGDLTAARTVLVDLGAGNDQFTANLNGAVANPTGLDLEAYGDAGNDQMTINQSGASQAGNVIAYLDGGAGNDTLTYNGTGNIASGASLLPGLSGGAGNDTLKSSYAGVDDGNYIYNLSIDGGAGNDNISDDVHLLAGSTGTVGSGTATPAAVLGSAGNDQIRFAVEVDPGAAPAGVSAVVAGGTGKDTVQHTSNVLGDPTNEKDTFIS
jgi:Ca2+-binding RTX toxin-like protein